MEYKAFSTTILRPEKQEQYKKKIKHWHSNVIYWKTKERPLFINLLKRYHSFFFF